MVRHELLIMMLSGSLLATLSNDIVFWTILERETRRKQWSVLKKVGLSSERLVRIRPVIEKHIGGDKIAGALTLIARRGELVHLECVGLMDRENSRPMQTNTIFRLYSMTKPIISVALMMLHEKGHFQLFHPVSAFIPAFKDLRVYAGEGESGAELVDLEREVATREEEFIRIQMAQFQPGAYHQIRQDFRVMAYRSIVD